MKIYIASDHRGVEIEKQIVENLKKNYDIVTTKQQHYETDDYVDFAIEIASNVAKDQSSLGILICGTGIGMSIAANKVKGVRAARCTSKDDAYYAKMHNAANILCIGISDINSMLEIINTFLETPSASEKKHLNRVNKIINYENGAYNEL